MTWKPVSLPAAIKRDEVHLWLMSFRDLLKTIEESRLAELLSIQERERAARLQHAGKRSFYMAGRAGLKVLVNAYTGCPVRKIRLEYGAKGKPALAGDSSWLKFNYSVSSGWALYAFSKGRELGIDLEMHPRNTNVQGLSRRILSSAERRRFDSIESSRRNAVILDFWTRKEAYGKLLGVGILYNMNQTSLIGSLDSACWESSITGLFGHKSNQREDGRVYGMQIGLPIPGSAALMYDASNDGRPHPDLRAFRWTAVSSCEAENSL